MTRAAVRRQVTVVRAAARGAKFPFSSRGPPKKRKARSPERTFANIFCTTPYNPKKFRARRRAMILIVFCRDRRWIAAKRQEKPPWGVCVTKNASHAANARLRRVRCRGVQSKIKKGGFRRLFW